MNKVSKLELQELVAKDKIDVSSCLNINAIALFFCIFTMMLIIGPFLNKLHADEGNQQGAEFPPPDQKIETLPLNSGTQQSINNAGQQNSNAIQTDDGARRPSDNQKKEPLNPGQEMQQKIEKERQKNFKGLKKDEEEYYKHAAPKSSDASDYFRHGHPLKPSPLKSNPVR